MRRPIAWAAVALAVAVAAPLVAQQSDEEVAARQLESGRVFLKQGKYTEALRDFRAVADTHPTSSVADDALLEIGRYFLDIVGDTLEAGVAVDAILKKYPTSNSAPDAYNMAGRLALSRSHQKDEIDTAIANFDRVPRLFPTSEAVPRARVLLADALWLSRRYDDAIAELGLVEADYPTDPAAAGAYLAAGKVRVPLGDPIAAMEELQQVRDRFPNTPEAALALARLTLLHRLYVRATAGLAFGLTTETVGPAKLENVVGLAMTSKDTLYWASESAAGVALPANGEKPPAVVKPRGVTLDTTGGLVIIDTGVLQPHKGKGIVFPVVKSNGQTEVMAKLNAAAQMSNGDWLVMDDAEKWILRFNREGTYIGVFAQTKVAKLVVNALDEVAAIDKDNNGIALFDNSGKMFGRIPLKTAKYEIKDPQDLAFDDFGHLYVLDRAGIAVFSPYAPKAAAAAAAKPQRNPVESPYPLLTYYTEPEKAPGAFKKASAFAVDRSGGVYLYDENAKKIMVYR
jgi:TolA-binding protein